MTEKKYDVGLTLEELFLLDGKVSDKAQAVIEKAKAEAGYGFDFPLIGEILRKAEQAGKFTWRTKQIRACKYCDKDYECARYPRSGRYHNKGDKNFDKPIYYSGIEFNRGFVNMEGIGDICTACATERHILQTVIDYILDNDLKIEIQKNDYRDSQYIFDPEQVCFKCSQPMYESEMGRKMTVMGDGTYPSRCPHCEAESTAFGPSHKTTRNHRMLKGEPRFLSNQSVRPSHVPVRELAQQGGV